jgi:hypothetical protein
VAKAPSSHITDEHYAAFGRIVNTIANIDGLLDGVITAMVQAKQKEIVLPLLTMLSSKSKIDYIVAIGKESTMSPAAIKELEKLMDRVRRARGLRNDIAHCTWMPGTKPGTIKPLAMSARTVLKMLGVKHNENQWTANALNAEANRYRELGHELADFMKRTGLLPGSTKREPPSPPPPP